MITKTAFALVVFTLVSGVATCRAQAESAMPKAGAEHQRMLYFVGNWQIDWETLPGPMGPGGRAVVTEHNEMLGNFFLIFHRQGRGANGSGKEIGIMRYDRARKLYTYENFSDDGDLGLATLTVSGDTWTLRAPDEPCRKLPDDFKERFTFKEVSPSSYTFINEISVQGGPWTKVEQGKAVKK